ncbi:sugar phosphate isomerase/epimerase family protein [Ruthenibacterium lactatiformans]|jgi:sugar phosphate isomerase/epimerase|uniref:sugar phosphate isomerase/epimerase family protein n=1 Tax=Ruthenibacterium lactatiformans TaxID=1550024 RepID=UPI00140352BA|nr:sugar phosphate isomerase/epimerase family protein [Ruthenibacterium lactatiformans]
MMEGKRLSLMTFNFSKDYHKKTMTVQDSLMLAADEGIPYVDVMRADAKSASEYRKAMAATGVQIYCYISCISFFAKKQAICAALDRDMAVAKSLKAKSFMIVPYYMMIDNPKAKRLGRERVLELMVSGFRMAVEKGNEYGLKVCFETTPAEEIRLSGTEDCKYVLERVPGLGLVFDTANMLPHGDETLAACEMLREFIVHVHLKDVALAKPKFSLLPDERTADGRLMKGTVFGQGVIPVGEIYERMKQSGYTGVFAIEYIHPDNRACTLSEHKSELAKYLTYLDGGNMNVP